MIKMDSTIPKITSLKEAGRMGRPMALELQSIMTLQHLNKEFINRVIKDLAKEKTFTQTDKLMKESFLTSKNLAMGFISSRM